MASARDELNELSHIREYVDANSWHPGATPTHAEQSGLSYDDLQPVAFSLANSLVASVPVAQRRSALTRFERAPPRLRERS